MKFLRYKGIRYVGPHKPAPATFTRCGTCHRAWDDAAPTELTPAPSARCPFEYFRGHGGTAKKPKWETVPDKDIRHVWAEPDDASKTVTVSPSFYEESGTPICDDDSETPGDDMVYLRTEIRKKN